MEWWQTVLVSLASVGATLGVAYFTAWLNQRAIKGERKYREETELCRAVECLLAETDGNIHLTGRPIFGGALPQFATDMWDMYKGKLVHLPAELQKSLHYAYFLMGNINAGAEASLHVMSKTPGRSLYNTYEAEVEKQRSRS